MTLDAAIWVHQSRREGHLIQERAEEESAVAREHGFPDFLAWGTLYRGGALIAQGQVVEGLALLREDLAVTAQGEIGRTYFLVELAEGYARIGQAQEGMAVVAEAFQWVEKNDERIYEAELYRLKGELTLQQESRERGAGSPEHEAEACFQQAIAFAQKQQAKSLELRAVMSLARLWQSQGKRAEAHNMLSEIYHWFTEGFDTKDLQEAKALLAEVA